MGCAKFLRYSAEWRVLPGLLPGPADCRPTFMVVPRPTAQYPADLSEMFVVRLGLRGNGIERIADHALPPNVVHLILTDNVLTELSVGVVARLGKVRLTI